MSADDVSLGEVVRLLKSLDGKIDKYQSDHEQRLRTLEKWMYALPASLVLSLGSIGLAIFEAFKPR